MKKIENNFAVSGFVGNNAEIRQFATSSAGSAVRVPAATRKWVPPIARNRIPPEGDLFDVVANLRFVA